MNKEAKDRLIEGLNKLKEAIIVWWKQIVEEAKKMAEVLIKNVRIAKERLEKRYMVNIRTLDDLEYYCLRFEYENRRLE